MAQGRVYEDVKFVRRYSIIGIIVVCLLSIPLHFSFEWSGGNPIVGMFTPINESIWEHLKLVFWPLLLWWGMGYVIFKKSKNLSFSKWVPSGTFSILFSMIFIAAWYYFWTAGLHLESSIIDVGSLFIAVPLAQLIAMHLYRILSSRPIYVILSLGFIVLFMALFIYYTFARPEVPLFIPPSEQEGYTRLILG